MPQPGDAALPAPLLPLQCVATATACTGDDVGCKTCKSATACSVCKGGYKLSGRVVRSGEVQGSAGSPWATQQQRQQPAASTVGQAWQPAFTPALAPLACDSSRRGAGGGADVLDSL